MRVGRNHHRLLSGLAFGLIALVAELGGRSMTMRDRPRPARRHSELRAGELLPRPARRSSRSGSRCCSRACSGAWSRRARPSGRRTASSASAPRVRGCASRCRRDSGSCSSRSPLRSTSSRPTRKAPPPGAGRCSRRGSTRRRFPSSRCSRSSARSSGLPSAAGSRTTRSTRRRQSPVRSVSSGARCACAVRASSFRFPRVRIFGLAFESRPPPLAA